MPTRRPRVAVITEAAESPQAQLRRRQTQYFVLMGLRALCLIVAAVLVSAKVPFLLFWVLLLTLGMVLFPWAAVLIANDRPPRQRSRVSTWLRRGASTPRAVGPSGPSGEVAVREPGGWDEPPPSA